MLQRVLDNGVTEARVAAALNVDLRSVREKSDLLKGNCPEVVKLLEDRRLSVRAFATLRKMKPVRQIEASEHMIASNNFTVPFLRAILTVTKPDMLAGGDAKNASSPQKADQALLETEHDVLIRDLKNVERSFGHTGPAN